MTYAINFNETVLKNIEFDYIKVKLNPDNIKWIQGISKELCKHIAIPPLALKGIICHSLGEWQEKHKKLISDISNNSVGDIIIATKEIFASCKKTSIEVLKSPKDQSELLLDIAFERGFKNFIENFRRFFH
ncbi:MAG: hypothetical protein KGD73_04850 [Candidatus Lokiarchaeota archaeon]|nr:hypothetical protein [Candidatus Lokiarchaeota archaeon]